MKIKLDECPACRIIGTAALLGIASYAWYERNRVLKPIMPSVMNLSEKDRSQLMKTYQEASKLAARHRNVLAGVSAGMLFYDI